ncbi:putative capsid protein small subunit, partial [Escherichia coli 5905]
VGDLCDGGNPLA